MPSPPISPTPRRWRSNFGSGPEERFSTLLDSFESTSGQGGFNPAAVPLPPSQTQSEDDSQRSYATAPGSPQRSALSTPAPEIRTTSPSPQRHLPGAYEPGAYGTSGDASPPGSSRSLSPLLAPSRNQLFDEAQAHRIEGRSFLTPGLGPRAGMATSSSRLRPFSPSGSTSSSSSVEPQTATQPQALARSDSLHSVHPQQTGQSTSTLDLAYDGVLASLNALAGEPQASRNTFGGPATPVPIATSPSRTPTTPVSYIGRSGYFGESTRLEAVSERTEPASTVSSLRGSPMHPLPSEHGRMPSHDSQRTTGTGTMDSSSVHSIAARFPLPPSPVKGPRPTSATFGSPASAQPQTSPKKTSDLIKMFESRSGATTTASAPTTGLEPAASSFTLASPFQTPATSTQPATSSTLAKAQEGLGAGSRFQSIFATPTAQPRETTTAAGSSFRPPFAELGPRLSQQVPLSGPTPPPKSPSPMSNIRTLIASWRARAGSPSQRVIGSPGRGGDGPKLFGRDKGWNVSIRRRKRHEGREGMLAEQAEDQGEERGAPSTHPSFGHEPGQGTPAPASDAPLSAPSVRTASMRSSGSDAREMGPRVFTGEPIRTGSLYYLNVHDPDQAPHYRWIQADARLFPEGLQIMWGTPEGGSATVTLDLEFCEEVASTYSPTNPLAGDDIGALAARRQGELAETLYPFKLVYDDGTERLACDSARERVRWVQAIWTVLERTRTIATAGGHSGSVRSVHAGSAVSHHSEGGGSSSTHITHQRNGQAPSPHPGVVSDDAVITTSAGLAAPLIQRGSRRLAPSRSLRRVASEADLTDIATQPATTEEDILSPVTARTRPASRDFTFAGGIPPPSLTSPPPSYTSPVRGRGAEGFATPLTYGSEMVRTPEMSSTAPPFGTATQGVTSTGTYGTASQGPVTPTGTYATPGSRYPGTFGTTAHEPSESAYTARESESSRAQRPGKQASESMETTQQGSSAMYTARHRSSTTYTTRPPSPQDKSSQGYATAQQMTSPAHTAQQPESSQTYGTAVEQFSPAFTVQPPESSRAYGTAQAPSESRYTAQPAASNVDYGTAYPPSESGYTARHGGSSLSYATAPAPSEPSQIARPAESIRSFSTAPLPSDSEWTARHPDSTATFVTAPPPSASLVTARPAESSIAFATAREGSEAGVTAQLAPSNVDYATAQSPSESAWTAPPAGSIRTTGTAPELAGTVWTARPPSTAAHTARLAASQVQYQTASDGRSEAAYTAQPPSTFAGTPFPLEYQTPQWTAREPSELAYTAIQPPPIPRVAVTQATPSEHTTRESDARSSSVYTSAHEALSTAMMTAPASQYGTAGPPSLLTSYAPATAGQLGSPFQTPEGRSRESMASYHTAPPPAPSKDSAYSTPSQAPSERTASPTRYQLFDNPVPMLPESTRYSTALEGTSYVSATQPTQTQPTTVMVTADEGSRGDEKSVHTAHTSQYASALLPPQAESFHSASSQRASHYSTAPPPPISRSTTPGKLASWRSDVQEWETATHISEPDEDPDLLARLERNSSNGSDVRASRERSQPPPQYSKTRSYATQYSGEKTPVGTAQEPTLYSTARDNSLYTTVASWQTPSTYMSTMMNPAGAQEAVRSTQESMSGRLGSGGGGPPSRKPPSSVSTARSEPSSGRSKRVPIPALPPHQDTREQTPPSPPPPPPSSSGKAGDGSGTPTASTYSSSVLTRHSGNTDINRLINYLQGQDTARRGEDTRLASQLDRIENKVGQIAETLPSLSAERERPPPVPSKYDDRSPPSSPSSVSSTASTARPVTPPPLVLPESLMNQLSDMRNLLGTVIGQNNDLRDEMNRRRSYEVELPSHDPRFRRLEDLLRRALLHLGDTDIAEELDRIPSHPSQPITPGGPRAYDANGRPIEDEYPEGSMYEGGGSIYSDEFNPKVKAPVNSVTSEYARRQNGFSPVPSSLLDGSLGDPEFDDEFAIQNLPSEVPPSPYRSRHVQVPQALSNLRRKAAPPPPAPREPSIQEEEEYYPEDPEPSPEPPVEEPQAPTPVSEVTQPLPRSPSVQSPVPYRDEVPQEPEGDQWDEEDDPGRSARRLPPPLPVDLPTPVRSPRDMPQGPPMPPGSGPAPFRPWPPVGGPIGPGYAEYPRPSLPRAGGVRDPISTTYYRRGFPPGPMGMPPMGMFPGPMGMPGPGMGPYMPGLRPGLNGFGGPIGPNVAPHLRRPGVFPPGVTGTTGDYGLPPAAHYPGHAPPPPGPSGPGGGRPPLMPDQGLSGSSTTSPVTSEQLITPFAPQQPLAPEPTIVKPTSAPVTPGGETDDGFRRAFDHAEAMAQAQGEQQNEISRYLHGMSDQLADTKNAHDRELSNILADIGRLREELKPKHVLGHVLPDGRVVLSNGDIVDGIRGAPIQPQPGTPLPPPPTDTHVQGRILPDGTVMVGDRVIDGIRGAAPTPAVPGDTATAQELRNMEQDRRLAELQDKIADLMHRTIPPTPHGGAGGAGVIAPDEDIGSTRAAGPTPRPIDKDIHREKHIWREKEIYHNTPGGREKEVDVESVHEFDTRPGAPQTTGRSAASIPLQDAAGFPLPPSAPLSEHDAPTAAAPAPVSVMPPTAVPDASARSVGKSPAPGVSLQPTNMEPIVDQDLAPSGPGQLIREEHEEIISRPTNGGQPVVTHTTTRTYHPGPPGTAVPPTLPPQTVYGDEPVDFSNVPTQRPGAHRSDHESVVEGDVNAPPGQFSSHEAFSTAPRPVPMDENVGSTSHTRTPGRNAKPVWDTNHPKTQPPATEFANVPTDTGRAPTVVPDKVVTDEPNAPVDPSTGMLPQSGAPARESDPALQSGPGTTGMPDPSGQTPATPGTGGKGVRWDDHMPEKEVPMTPGRQPGSTAADAGKGSKRPTPATNADMALPPGGGAGMPSLPPSGPADQTYGDAPNDPAQSGHPSAHGSPSFQPTHQLEPVHDTNHPSGKTSPNIISKLTPKKSKESLRARPGSGELVAADGHTVPVHGHGQGPPVTSEVGDTGLTGTPGRLADNDKNTRFSDVTHHTALPQVPVGPSDSSSLRSVADPTGNAGQSSRPMTPNKIRKTPPGADAGGQLPQDTTPGNAGNQSEYPGLHKIILADGTPAYVSDPNAFTPPPSITGSKKSKARSIEDPRGVSSDTASGPPAGAGGVSGATPRGAESILGQGHCSVCCPHGPKPGTVVEPCEHQPSKPASVADRPPSLAPSARPTKNKTPAPSVRPLGLPGEEDTPGAALAMEGELADTGGVVVPTPNGSNKLKKTPKSVHSQQSNPEDQMDEARRIALRQKAAAEQAAAETAEREAKQKEKEEKARLAEDRHRQNAEALANLARALDALAKDQKDWRTAQDGKGKDSDKRRAEKAARDKKFQELLDALAKDSAELKKRNGAEDKKPGTQAILDALKTAGDGQAAFLRKLAAEINEQNSNQHAQTQAAMKTAAREQVGFNLAGYLDDFSKALSGEVRALLKEVGDLRESRRALYMELAELLLMKGRQSAGDLMAILPYPVAPPKNPNNKNEKKDGGGNNNNNGGGNKGDGGGGGKGNKNPGGVPAWSGFVPPLGTPGMVIGGPPRPLPNPGMPALNMIPGLVPGPPPAMMPRPMPQLPQ